MDEEPSEPSDEALELHFSGTDDGVVFADDGHHAFVEVIECGAGIGFEDFGDVGAHLDGGGGDSGDDLSVAVLHADEVSGDEDVWVAGN